MSARGGASRPVAIGGKGWSAGASFLSQRAKMEASVRQLLLPLLVVLTATSLAMGWEQPGKARNGLIGLSPLGNRPLGSRRSGRNRVSPRQ